MYFKQLSQSDYESGKESQAEFFETAEKTARKIMSEQTLEEKIDAYIGNLDTSIQECLEISDVVRDEFVEKTLTGLKYKKEAAEEIKDLL
jgi:hypothetical protein